VTSAFKFPSYLDSSSKTEQVWQDQAFLLPA
jgi:hypothetical protein